jgi:hypothetical protein
VADAWLPQFVGMFTRTFVLWWGRVSCSCCLGVSYRGLCCCWNVAAFGKAVLRLSSRSLSVSCALVPPCPIGSVLPSSINSRLSLFLSLPLPSNAGRVLLVVLVSCRCSGWWCATVWRTGCCSWQTGEDGSHMCGSWLSAGVKDGV